MVDNEINNLLNLREEYYADLGYNILDSNIIELVRHIYQKTNQSSAEKVLVSFYDNYANISL